MTEAQIFSTDAQEAFLSSKVIVPQWAKDRAMELNGGDTFVFEFENEESIAIVEEELEPLGIDYQNIGEKHLKLEFKLSDLKNLEKAGVPIVQKVSETLTQIREELTSMDHLSIVLGSIRADAHQRPKPEVGGKSIDLKLIKNEVSPPTLPR